MYTGSMAGLAASPQMVKSLGWPSVFYIFGSLGLVWSIFWQRSASSSPHDDELMSEEERKYVTDNTVSKVCRRLCHTRLAIVMSMAGHLCIEICKHSFFQTAMAQLFPVSLLGARVKSDKLLSIPLPVLLALPGLHTSHDPLMLVQDTPLHFITCNLLGHDKCHVGPVGCLVLASHILTHLSWLGANVQQDISALEVSNIYSKGLIG